MKNLVAGFYEIFANNEEFQRQVANYERALKGEPYKFYKDALLLIKAQMAQVFFSRTYTLLDAVEKDVMQRTYFNVNQIIDFLVEPQAWARKKGRFQRFMPNLQSKVKPNSKEG